MKFTWSRKTSRIIIAICVVIVTGLPVAASSYQIWKSQQVLAKGVPLTAPDTGIVATYRSNRDTLVDLLLPAGAGGTHYLAELGDNNSHAGEAYTQVAAIALTGQGLNPATEVHERTHLLDTGLDVQVARLMRRMPAPAKDEYAAKNDQEHFAEMATNAWNIVRPIPNFCPIEGVVEQLATAEKRVPGTSGFVSRFIRSGLFQGLAEREALLAAADSLQAPFQAEWDAIWTSLDARRAANGAWPPWPAMTILGGLQKERQFHAELGGLYHSYEAILLWPSIGLARVIGGSGVDGR